MSIGEMVYGMRHDARPSTLHVVLLWGPWYLSSVPPQVARKFFLRYLFHLTPWEPWFPWLRHGPDDLVFKTSDQRIIVQGGPWMAIQIYDRKERTTTKRSVWLWLKTTKYYDSWQFGVENMCFQTVLAPSWYFRLYKIGPESIFKWQCC